MSGFWKRVLVGWILVMGIWMYGVQMWEGTTSELGTCRVEYVYDGDTVSLICPDGKKHTARLQGFDTPETKSPGCAAELALGRKATQRLRGLVSSGAVSYHALGHDKYGRELIRLDVDGVDVGETLVSEGLAKRYTGGSRINWCRYLRRG